MGFLDVSSGGGVFLEIGDKSHKKKIRPLVAEPIQKWLHKFPTPETAADINGKLEKLRLRDYHEEICTSTDRRGSGCRVHSRPDPAWNFLSTRDQTNKKGQRVDFPAAPKWFVPVWDYDAGAVKMLRGGSQIYDEMNKWYDTGRAITECDWEVWKEGEGKSTEYKSMRCDASAFTVEVTEEQKKEVMDGFIEEYKPLPDDKLAEKMAVLSVEEAKKRFLEKSNKGGQTALPAAGSSPQLPPASDPRSALKALFPTWSDEQIDAALAAQAAAANPQ